MKGIFLTFFSVLIFLSLIMYAFEMKNAYSSRRIINEYNSHLSRLSYIQDDISTDLSNIYGIEYRSDIANNYTTQTYRLIRLQRNLSQQFLDYYNYINSTYSDLIHANLSLNLNTNQNYANITCDDGLFLFKNYTSNSTYLYLNSSIMHNATIELYVDSNFISGNAWSEISNETQVYLHVASKNGTDVNSQYSLRKTIDNDYLLNYTDGILHIEFGNVGVGAEGIYVHGAPLYDANFTIAVDSNTTKCYYLNSSFIFAQPVANETGIIPVVSYP